MPSLFSYLEPYQFYPTVLISCLVSAVLFWLGLRQRRRQGLHTGFWRPFSFYLGLILFYVVMQTYVDYVSQHMFWVHRVQHLILHHIAPLLIVLSYPHEVMSYGLPERWRTRMLLPIWNSLPVRACYGFLQNPIVAPFLFAGLIYFWLTPSIHFDAMLSLTLYKIMNWSMVLDGLLFWWLVVDKRKPVPHRTYTYPIRIIILFVVMIAQILIGAYITLSHRIIYSVYSVCGRAWPISPMTDQTIGGLTTWIPGAMMSVIGILLVVRLWMKQSVARHKLVTMLAADE